ncbi:MAG TPA: hemerythrin domain-containing protein [Myxococcales bacterium]|nr:hemerythrin domain-containing protein [Myxococcales bacterium]
MSEASWILMVAAAAATGAFPAELPTQSFRDEHKEVKLHLGHVAQWAGQLLRQQPAEQKATAGKIVSFFRQEIGPHAEWEEKTLYPVIDRLAGTSEHNRFTSTMRHEHRIVGRWTGELAREIDKRQPDYVAFVRRTDNLLGLLWAHFEEEEEVLLPYADRQMTRAQFEKAVEHSKEGAHP